MDSTITLSIALEPALVAQIQSLAQHLQVSEQQIITLALEAFTQQAPQMPMISTIPDARRIRQGDIFWVQPHQFSAELGSYAHPYVVIQDDLLNASRITTVVVCGLTSNLRQANAPGNVLLEPDEAHLPKQSVIDVSKVSTVLKAQLGEYVGSLAPQRIQQIRAGMQFLHRTFFTR